MLILKNNSRLFDRYLFLFFILALTIFKCWLVWGLRIRVESGQSFDDALYIRFASTLINGEWLGTYNNLTLAKMPGYPLWLAFNHFLGLPLLFTQHLLYVLAGLVFIFPLRKIVTSRTILLVLYTIYLFNPAIETRVMREGIYPALTVLVFAALIGFHVYRDKLWQFSLWSIFLGLALSALWLTREEGIVIIPSVLLMMSYILFQFYQTAKLSHYFFKRVIFFIFPFTLLLANIHLISAINKNYYGVHTLTEISAKPFVSAYGALSRVKHQKWKRYLPVPEEVRQKIYAVSPAFKELESLLEGDVGKIWVPLTCAFYPDTCPDIGGVWFMWALREAVSHAGYYQSATKAKEYYHRLATEVNLACDQGKLDCLSPRETLVSPYHPEYIKVGIQTFFIGVQRILSLPIPEYVYSELAQSVATEQGQKVFYEITHNPVSAIATTEANQRTLSLSKEEITKLNISKTIAWIYRSLLLPISYLIIPLYLLCLTINLIQRKITPLLIFNLAIIGAIISRLTILIILEISSFPTLFIWWAYLVPFYPLLLLFLVLATVEAFQRCTSNKVEKP